MKKSESKESGFDPEDRNGLDPITNKKIYRFDSQRDGERISKRNHSQFFCQRLEEEMTEILHGREIRPRFKEKKNI